MVTEIERVSRPADQEPAGKAGALSPATKLRERYIALQSSKDRAAMLLMQRQPLGAGPPTTAMFTSSTARHVHMRRAFLRRVRHATLCLVPPPPVPLAAQGAGQSEAAPPAVCALVYPTDDAAGLVAPLWASPELLPVAVAMAWHAPPPFGLALHREAAPHAALFAPLAWREATAQPATSAFAAVGNASAAPPFALLTTPCALLTRAVAAPESNTPFVVTAAAVTRAEHVRATDSQALQLPAAHQEVAGAEAVDVAAGYSGTADAPCVKCSWQQLQKALQADRVVWDKVRDRKGYRAWREASACDVDADPPDSAQAKPAASGRASADRADVEAGGSGDEAGEAPARRRVISSSGAAKARGKQPYAQAVRPKGAFALDGFFGYEGRELEVDWIKQHGKSETRLYLQTMGQVRALRPDTDAVLDGMPADSALVFRVAQGCGIAQGTLARAAVRWRECVQSGAGL